MLRKAFSSSCQMSAASYHCSLVTTVVLVAHKESQHLPRRCRTSFGWSGCVLAGLRQTRCAPRPVGGCETSMTRSSACLPSTGCPHQSRRPGALPQLLCCTGRDIINNGASGVLSVQSAQSKLLPSAYVQDHKKGNVVLVGYPCPWAIHCPILSAAIVIIKNTLFVNLCLAVTSPKSVKR